MAYITDLKTRRATVAAKLAALTDTAAGGKANTSGGGGAHVDHTGYKASLYAELKDIEELISNAAANAQAEDLATNGPWELLS